MAFNFTQEIVGPILFFMIVNSQDGNGEGHYYRMINIIFYAFVLSRFSPFVRRCRVLAKQTHGA